MSMKKIGFVVAGLLLCGGALAQEKAAPSQSAEERGGRGFERADADKDGKITLDELKKVMPNATEERFKAWDKDGDGSLTREEMPRPGEGLIQRADKDGDKKVSKEEFKAAMPNASEERFTRLDVNGDGFVEQSEVASRSGERGQDGGGGPGRGRIGEMFERADADKDGKVTAEEFKKVAPDAPEDRFKSMDRNGDGVVSRDDFGRPAEAPATAAPEKKSE